MIARVWSAQTTATQAPAYVEHLRTQVLPVLQTLKGYGGVLLLQRAIPGATEVQVITFWQSLDSVRDFAGADLERAVVADEAAALLTEFDRRVRHYEVALSDKV
jgi:heme-degrading monooxygenase HmoA